MKNQNLMLQQALTERFDLQANELLEPTVRRNQIRYLQAKVIIDLFHEQFEERENPNGYIEHYYAPDDDGADETGMDIYDESSQPVCRVWHSIDIGHVPQTLSHAGSCLMIDVPGMIAMGFNLDVLGPVFSAPSDEMLALMVSGRNMVNLPNLWAPTLQPPRAPTSAVGHDLGYLGLEKLFPETEKLTEEEYQTRKQQLQDSRLVADTMTMRFEPEGINLAAFEEQMQKRRAQLLAERVAVEETEEAKAQRLQAEAEQRETELDDDISEFLQSAKVSPAVPTVAKLLPKEYRQRYRALYLYSHKGHKPKRGWPGRHVVVQKIIPGFHSEGSERSRPMPERIVPATDPLRSGGYAMVDAEHSAKLVRDLGAEPGTAKYDETVQSTVDKMRELNPRQAWEAAVAEGEHISQEHLVKVQERRRLERQNWNGKPATNLSTDSWDLPPIGGFTDLDD